MPWLESASPVRMARVALVAPAGSLRAMLVRLAGAGVVEIDKTGADEAPVGEAARRLQAAAGAAAVHEMALGPGQAGSPAQAPALSVEPPDLDLLEREGRLDLLAGEAELEGYTAVAVRGAGAVALAGWTPAFRVEELAMQLEGLGCGVVPLPSRGASAPTLLTVTGARPALTPLVSMYATVPYADLDPTWLAWISYVLMFGMMFGDIGHGLLLVGLAVALRAGWPGWLRRFRAAWPFVGGAGIAAALFGIAYGEFFGPTGLVPAAWLDPLASPVPLLLAAVGFGAVLLAVAYGMGTINRWREGGWPVALYAPSGIAGSALFLGIGLAAAGWHIHHGVLLIVSGVLVTAALFLAFAGFLADAGGGGTGVFQAVVELFDLVVRLGSNVVSFARLAAFGLTHAAIGLLVWEGTLALWHRGGPAVALAIVVFAVGTLLAFGLEALIAAIQALRLEYYEIFSRVFLPQGRPFDPWRLAIETRGGGLNTRELVQMKEGA
jgi:V/A-type H+-transporting ATPase subunit I